ncbi:MAG: hypothetical protein ABEH47_04445 [Haloferacaceae archaeon]
MTGAVPADVRGDLLVAGAAAGATVALSVLLRVVLDLRVGVLLRVAPLAVYPLYTLFGRGDTGSRFEEPRLWAALSLLVALGVLARALTG